MKPLLFAALAAAAGLLTAGAAPAQYFNPALPGQPLYGPGSRPMLSPYLDLTRGGIPAVNYYLGTIPEIQRRNNAQVFRSAILDLEARTSTGAVPLLTEEEELLRPLPSTGHPTAFGVSAGYFGVGTTASGGGLNRAAPTTPARPPSGRGGR
jgi:hypothetical protein